MRVAHVRTSLVLMTVWTVLALNHAPLLRDPGAGQRAAVLTDVICLVGLGLRQVWLRSHRSIVFSVQLLVYCGAAALMLAGPARDGTLRPMLEQTGQVVLRESAPLPEDPGVAIGYALVVGLVVLLCELFVFVAREPAWTVVPIGLWYAVYALLPGRSAPWTHLVLALVAFAAILGTDTINRSVRWPRHLTDDTGSGLDLVPTVARLGGLMTLGALVAGLVLGSVMPVLPRSASRTDVGGGDVTLSDPRLDLRQNLRRNDGTPALTYTSTDARGVRLQLAVLQTFNRAGWQVSPMGVTRFENQTTFGPVPGLATEPPARTRTSVTMDLFRSNFLPLPYAARQVSVEGRWGVDPATLVTFTTADDPDQALVGKRYGVESVSIEPTVRELQAATTSGAPRGTTALPAELSPRVVELAQRVTANATTPAERAAALQAYLRGPAFRYDLDGAPDVSGISSIEEFLLESRVGYCEQFAGAMSVMARAVQLPSRVVIGFLPGEQQADGSWLVTNRQMHAWSEVWFDGFGWVRFDATPGSVSGEPPTWTPPVTVGNPTLTPTPTPTSTPTPTQATARPRTTPTPTPEAAAGARRGPGLPGWLLPALLVVALLGAVTAAPRLLRESRRRSRRAASTPQARVLGAWEEIRDTVVDHGGRWPRETPRRLADLVGDGFAPETDDRLWYLALAVERARYGRGVQRAPEDLDGTVEAVRQEIVARAQPRQRLLATWWPRSLWSR